MAPVVEKDGIRVAGDAPEPEAEESQSSKPIIGIIYPPPEVRNIVDKTASFVGRNGPEFEARIRQNEINNSKFNFLNTNDPYHAYYRHKVKEFIEGKAKEPSVPKPAAPVVKFVFVDFENLASRHHSLAMKRKAKPTRDPEGRKEQLCCVANQQPSVAVVQEQFVPKDPPAQYEFIADPPSISAYDLDVVRLTAQFVARNGRSFLTQLMQREAKNFQFDFLRPQHSLFQYFTKLCEQYSKILIPPKSALEKLDKEGNNPKVVLDEVKYRVAWTRHEERVKQREQAAIEKEKLLYAQIDWHDFVVVETVDFQPEERGNFPRPVSVDELGARLLQEERLQKYGEEALQEDSKEDEEEEEEEVEQKDEQPQLVDMDMEESSEEEEEEPAPPIRRPVVQPAPPIAPPPLKDDIIIRDYNPKMRGEVQDMNKPGMDSYMVSPITGEKVPAGKIQEHMRFGLLDPSWKELKRKQIAEKQQEEEVFAAGSDIEASLKGLAERRTDIFGVEETAIGKKVGEEDQPSDEVVAWDGHSSSANATREKAKASVTIEEQIEHIQKTQGLLVDENLEKIGPKTTEDKPKLPEPRPVEAPVSMPRPVVSAAPPPPVQMQVAPQPVLTPVVMRPVIPVQQANPVVVVQQRMPVVQAPPPPQLIAVQRPPMMMQAPHAMVQQRVMAPLQPVPPMGAHPAMMEGPPLAKRPRTEADLLPAEAFLQHNAGPATFRVQCPNVPDKAEWKLQGQVLTFTLPLTDEVSVIKAKVHEATGMPAGKQKLQLDGLFIKDSNSLAFYNIVNGALISLQVKERGGRKK